MPTRCPVLALTAMMGAKLQERGLDPQPRGVLVEGPVVLLDEVPLVDDDHQADAFVDHVARDVGILRRQAVDGIEHEQRHIGPADGPQRPDGRELLRVGPGRDLAPPSDARGVHDAHRLAVPVDLGVDGIARGAGDVAHDDPLLAQRAS